MNRWEIKGKELQFYETGHIYYYDGECLPSITQMLQLKFGGKYECISADVLNRASEKGTAVHKAIELYETEGIDCELKELRNYKFLKKLHNFECVANEVPVVLFKDDKSFGCGRLDLVITKDGKKGLADIKRTSSLDKEYLGYQLNLYRIAYMQCYGEEIDFLAGIHLRDDKRKYVPIPIKESVAFEIIDDYEKEQERLLKLLKEI